MRYAPAERSIEGWSYPVSHATRHEVRVTAPRRWRHEPVIPSRRGVWDRTGKTAAGQCVLRVRHRASLAQHRKQTEGFHEAAFLDKEPASPVPSASSWSLTYAMLPQLAAEFSQNTAIAVYGPGSNWLYGMLVAFAQEFYQFDPRIGWLSPPHIRLGSEPGREDVTIKTLAYPDALRLSISLKTEYLDHLQADQLLFPPVSAHLGVIIDGKLPLWLVTALVRLYQKAGAPWIACYQPKLQGAVILFSHVLSYKVGDVIPLTVFGQR